MSGPTTYERPFHVEIDLRAKAIAKQLPSGRWEGSVGGEHSTVRATYVEALDAAQRAYTLAHVEGMWTPDANPED